MFADHLRAAIDAAPRITLPAITAQLWRAFGEGHVSEAEAEALSALIEARQVLRPPDPATAITPIGPDTPQDRVRSPRTGRNGSRPRTDASIDLTSWLWTGLIERISLDCIRDSVRRVIEALEQEQSVIDRSIDAEVDRSLEWRRKETLLTSIPGVGPTIARTLIAELPELESLNGKQVAALVGLAPWTRQSGQWRGRSFIAGGRAPVRTALFMEAMVASRHNAALETFHDRLIAAGKPKLVALIATARKLIAILRDGTPWQPA